MTAKLAKKWITFDATDTLFKIRGSVGQIYVHAANFHMSDANAKKQLLHVETVQREFFDSFKTVSKKWPNFGSNHNISSQSWWHEVVVSTLEQSGYSGNVDIVEKISEKLYHDFCHPKCWQLFDDVEEVLTRLQAEGYGLGVISNFDERLHLLLKNFQLNHFFQFVLCSKEVGYAKPDSRIFQVASELGGFDIRDCLHVGNRLDTDYEGALNSGMKAVLINRSSDNAQKLDPLTLNSLFRIFDII